MKLCSSDLRNYVEIQRATSTNDAAGGSELAWSVFGAIWCKVDEIAGSEGLEHGRVETRDTTRFTARYWEDVYATDRLVLDGVVYAIRFVNNEEFRDIATIIEAEAGVPDAQA